MTKKVERPYHQLGRPRKYSKEEAKQKYAENAKNKLTNLTDEEKELRKFKKKEYAKKTKEKINARRKQKMLDPEYREKVKKNKKLYEKRAKEKKPNFMIGDHIKKSAKNRNIDAPHAPLEYKNWYENHIKICYFCGNNNETIRDYLKKIGEKVGIQQNRLHIERLDSIKGYLLDNLTLACSICNTHKSDIISAEDFKEIAQKYIAPKIKNELG